MKNEPSTYRLASKVLIASVEGAVIGVVLTTIVVGLMHLLGFRGVLEHPALPFVIFFVGALGMVLTGRLSRKTFDDRS
ncbi:MAG: hypothetical protein AAFX52_10225 [Pseudomonadota bacterium]